MKTDQVYPTLELTAKFYQSELKKIYGFLSPLKGIWSVEVLNTYPETMKAYPRHWLDAMGKLSFEEQWQVEMGRIPEKLRGSDLGKIFASLNEFEDFPQWDFSPKPHNPTDYPTWALNYVSEKKQHEVTHLAALLEQSLHEKRAFKMIDIGGGKGHLGRILALYHGHDVTTLDTNAELQALGRERLERYPHPEGAGSLTFLNHTFGPHSESPLLDQKLFDEAGVTLGLHTCGPLSLEHLETYHSHQNLYNFGCCYQKLNTENEINLSDFSKRETPLEVTKHALTLATRGHTKISLKDYELKMRVKFYRAALHLWMSENTKDNTFITVGSAKAREYFGSFGDYALGKLEKFNLYACTSSEQLNDFYNAESTQEKLQDIFLANLIRWRFGRIIEKFILINRALWQVEQGNHAKLFQVFDAEISPRNTVLFIPAQK